MKRSVVKRVQSQVRKLTHISAVPGRKLGQVNPMRTQQANQMRAIRKGGTTKLPAYLGLGARSLKVRKKHGVPRAYPSK